MAIATAHIDFILQLADSTLVLAQRNAAWCAHGPILEQDIAITNITLDLLGQSRNFYQHAAVLINALGTQDDIVTEDSLAYLRGERDFKNLLLCELPNGDWARTILRQCFFSIYQSLLYTQLRQHGDEQLQAIAEKSLKEIEYHVRWSSEWVIRLGDGTAESRARLQQALQYLWSYTGEGFQPAAYETADIIGFDMMFLKTEWLRKVSLVLEEATLELPVNGFMQTGGKTGNHTENLGFILAEMQYLQRAYPGAEW